MRRKDSDSKHRTPARRKDDVVKADGEIVETLGFENFRVRLDYGVVILASVSGKMRQNHIRLITGDRVQVEMSPYDISRGRISYRYYK